MPAIDIQVMDGVFTAEEKAEIIVAVTRAFGGVAGDRLAANTSVRIHEIPSGAWGYGGTVLTTEDAKAIRFGSASAD
ncbi:4-oxalocrotonate tautomerase [Roseivivax jejudonensis]|uniref:4-oxalocrotonate tautomerase n=1 Tax=Roseivivax jejudonensis TaxID=1529041 RepID=A0A1X6Z795_9RHOB|nr:tautomerase family protein [Roseivivax jejudonensis]SLN42434.1 4-oxalocrotonate tautomerase [Roseivivax jejudonensis]